jgi:UDP-N-acetylmuramyl pentapeptide phosphotransferase/UDP-N-acetylglucosamine-1-phosphate transferase
VLAGLVRLLSRRLLNRIGVVPSLTSVESEVVAIYSAACVSVTALLIVATKSWHAALSMDHAHGVQKVHTEPTPRVGGLAIFVGLLCGTLQLMPSTSGEILLSLVLSGLPALLIGLAEDLTKRVPVLHRLVATMACGAVGWWLTGYSLTRLDVPIIDGALQVVLVSVLFTSFAIGGVANSINIIDGFNGLAAMTSTFALLGLGLIARHVGDDSLCGAAVLLAACAVGFLVINWPLGKIFLGDGGAYFLGFAIAWMAVMLVQRNSEVSAFSALVICAHPVNEVLFSVYRRWQAKAHPGEPDHMHLHSLVNKYLSSTRLSSVPPLLRNSMTGCLVAFFTLVAVVVALSTYRSTSMSVVAYLTMSTMYVATYLWFQVANKDDD